MTEPPLPRSVEPVTATCVWALDGEAPGCFLHGDAHLGNTTLDARGGPEVDDLF